MALDQHLEVSDTVILIKIHVFDMELLPLWRDDYGSAHLWILFLWAFASASWLMKLTVINFLTQMSVGGDAILPLCCSLMEGIDIISGSLLLFTDVSGTYGKTCLQRKQIHKL
jgi:hypothetical protein